MAQFFNDILHRIFTSVGPDFWLGYALAIAVHLALLINVVAVGALIFIWMERKGWMYYRKSRPQSSHSAGRGILSTFQEVVQPEIRYVKEDRDQRQSVSGNEDPSER